MVGLPDGRQRQDDRASITEPDGHCVGAKGNRLIEAVMPTLAKRSVIGRRAVPDSLPDQWKWTWQLEIDRIDEDLAGRDIDRMAGDGAKGAVDPVAQRRCRPHAEMIHQIIRGFADARAKAAPVLVACARRMTLPSPLNATFNTAPTAIAVSDGIGTPPMITLGLAEMVVPIIGPIGGSSGLGTENVQCFVMSTPMRAARMPSSQTDEEPRKISNIGKNLPHQIPMPTSPQRPAGIPLISTVAAPDTYGIAITGPVLGSGIGGAGGIRLGG